MNLDNNTVEKNPSKKKIEFIFQLFNSSKFEEAKNEIYKELKNYSESFVLYNILGAVLTSQNKLNEAMLNYNTSIKINSNYYQAYNNLGTCFFKLEKFDEAIKNYERSIDIKPNNPEAYNNLGSAYKKLGNNRKAITFYEKAIEILPNYADAYNNLGTILDEIGENEKSILNYKKAIEIQHNHPDAHNNLGAVFKNLKKYEQSIYHYEKAIEVKPNSPETYSNMGNSYKALGDYLKAIELHKNAIKINSNYADAYYNLAKVFDDLNEFNEAQKNYKKAIQIQPNHVSANTNLLFNTCWSNNDSQYLEIAKKYNNAIEKYDTNQIIKKNNKSLNVGFVSSDLRNHSVSFFLIDTLNYLKKKGLKLFAYYNNTIEDNVTKLLKKNFDKWYDIFYKKDKDLINLIKKDNIDILFDLNGHTANSRLAIFKSRCAPKQVTWCGWLASTGIKEVDYIIGDTYATPLENQKNFTEKIYQLKSIWQCFSISNSNFKSFNIKKNTEKNIIFGSFVNHRKINQNVIDIWSKILNKIPNSKLLLKCNFFSNSKILEAFLKRLNNKIEKKQLIIEGKSTYSDYMKTYNNIDIVLDTFPSSGATTSFEASYMGVPILTKSNKNNFWFKTGESINKNLNMHDWIAKNDDEYVEKAIKFSKNKTYLSDLKLKIRNHALKSPLFNSKKFSEEFYEMLLNIKNK